MAGADVLAEARAAGAAYGATMPPFTDEQADKIAALLAPYWPRKTAAQAAPTAA
jgi:hypothetical protein